MLLVLESILEFPEVTQRLLLARLFARLRRRFRRRARSTLCIVRIRQSQVIRRLCRHPVPVKHHRGNRQISRPSSFESPLGKAYTHRHHGRNPVLCVARRSRSRRSYVPLHHAVRRRRIISRSFHRRRRRRRSRARVRRTVVRAARLCVRRPGWMPRSECHGTDGPRRCAARVESVGSLDRTPRRRRRRRLRVTAPRESRALPRVSRVRARLAYASVSGIVGFPSRFPFSLDWGRARPSGGFPVPEPSWMCTFSRSRSVFFEKDVRDTRVFFPGAIRIFWFFTCGCVSCTANVALYTVCSYKGTAQFQRDLDSRIDSSMAHGVVFVSNVCFLLLLRACARS